MVDLYTEDDLEGCMTPKLLICHQTCSASDKCRRHVGAQRSDMEQGHEVKCNPDTKPAYYPRQNGKDQP
jgi:hypothetical protein